MSQLFTVYFPKYCFEVQEEFSISFPNADELPIEIDVTEKGVPYIKDIDYANANCIAISDERLKKGLRIVSINGDNLATEKRYGIFLTANNTPLSQKQVQNKIAQNDNSSIEFAFREDIPTFEDSKSLGLKFNEDLEDNKYQIPDDAILVSSYLDNDEQKQQCLPEHVRLNTPDSYWSPTVKNEKSRDVWICIDLGSKKIVDGIHIQGSQDHSAFVKEFWIEYSDDLCCWKSHPMRAIKCIYVAGQNENKKSENLSNVLNLAGAGELKQNSSEVLEINYTPDLNKFEYPTAEIRLWPVIHAQFIRIRPWKWKNHIAMRLDFCGNERIFDNPKYQQVGQVVTADTVCPEFKEQLQIALVGKDNDSKLIQIDCRAIITKAMDLAGCTTYSIMSPDPMHYLMIFTTANSATSERVMDSLTDVGVGRQMGVISATSIDWRNAAKKIEQQVVPKNATSTGFYASVQSHKAIQVVVERIMNSAALTFDYFCMLTIASMIAVGGLATDSAVIVVASMLVSPIMGPVLAFTFGVTLGNWPLAKLGARNECFSLLICLLIGFVVGFFYALGTKNRNDWPTSEMDSRGNPWALADGAYIAAASGVGVALSVLGDYLSTVVGVAISASLLPPAVNCGMLLSFCIYEVLFPQHVHSDDTMHDYNVKKTIISAVISFVLTIENIIIIFLSATIMFRIKDIVKLKDRNQEKMWDNISKFRQEFKLHHKAVAGVGIRTDLLEYKAMSDEDNDDVNREGVPIQQRYTSSGAHNNYQMDIYAKRGTKADKAVTNIKHTIEDCEDDILHSTLKGQVFTQITQYYSTLSIKGKNTKSNRAKKKKKKSKRKAGYINPETQDEEYNSSASDSLSNKIDNKARPLADVFKRQTEDKPLIASNDNIVLSAVIDEND